MEIGIQMCGGCITIHTQSVPEAAQGCQPAKILAVLITVITCVYVAPSCPNHLHEHQGMQLTMEHKEQSLRGVFRKGPEPSLTRTAGNRLSRESELRGTLKSEHLPS